MKYGRSGKGRSYNGTNARISRVTKTQKTARAAKFTAARAKQKGVKSNARGVASNARAIGLLKKQLYGPVQTQVSQFSQFVTFTKMHPLIFQVNNLACTTEGPKTYWYNSTAAHTFHLQDAGARFDVQYNNLNAHSLDYKVNGPRLWCRYVKLDFHFKGFVHDTRIRIDVIRQKKIAKGDAWRMSEASNMIFPYNASNFTALAGHTPYRIDTRMFQVLKTKHVYLNSAGTAPSTDFITGGVTHAISEPTTPENRYCTLYLPLKREFSQLDPSVNEVTGVDDTAMNASTDANNIDGTGSWQYTNQHPLKNIWVVCSTDDPANLSDAVTGKRVLMSCIRTCCWRDRHGDIPG